MVEAALLLSAPPDVTPLSPTPLESGRGGRAGKSFKFCPNSLINTQGLVFHSIKIFIDHNVNILTAASGF